MCLLKTYPDHDCRLSCYGTRDPLLLRNIFIAFINHVDVKKTDPTSFHLFEDIGVGIHSRRLLLGLKTFATHFFEKVVVLAENTCMHQNPIILHTAKSM